MTAVGGPSERIERARGRGVVVAFAAAALVALLAAGGCSSDDGPGFVAEGTYLLPPEGATEVSGATLPGAATLTFTFEERTYQLMQYTIAGGEVSKELASVQADAGAEPVELDGVGTVQVVCGIPSGPDLPDGTLAPVVTAASWVVDDTVYGNLEASEDPTGEACGSGDLSASPLVATVAGVRVVDGAAWSAYVAEHDIEQVEVPDSGPWYADPECANSGGAKVCAEPAGAISLTAEGLEPGSTFSWSSVSEYPGEPVDGEVVVADTGELPGALGIMTFGRSPTTITFSATTADGDPFTGTLELE